MNRKTLFTLLVLLFIILLTVAVTLIPEIIGQDMANWCETNLKPIFGEKYKHWLLGIVVFACVMLAFLTTEQGRALFSRSRQTADRNSENFNIPVTDRSRKLLNESKSAIEKADLKGTLDSLSEIHSPTLDAALLGLKSRLSEYTKDNHQGVLTWEHKTVGYNRLNTDVIALVSKLEKEFESDKGNYAEIRKYLIEKRYKPRVHQKLAGDQLFNLNVQFTTEGTTPEKADTFVTLQGRKTGEEIRQIFEKARRRLLVTGLPGAGKTSLLLNLALELLEPDHENLAVLLNLATWRSDFPSFDDWLREILPAELGVTKRYAADILQAGKLSLLLDGLDEVDEAHRASCLKAIGEYGRLGRDYVISTRKDEYKALEKDAPVWAQIEVLPLTDKQLLAQLDHADRRDFPEAPDLKAAMEHDPLLLRVAETPFYLNCLQLLFRGGNTLSELKLKGATVEERQAEITERFVEQATAEPNKLGSPEQVRHWLAFLASRMAQRNKVVFELVDLQYDWWRWGKQSVATGFSGKCLSLFIDIISKISLLIIPVLVTFYSINNELCRAFQTVIMFPIRLTYIGFAVFLLSYCLFYVIPFIQINAIDWMGFSTKDKLIFTKESLKGRWEQIYGAFIGGGLSLSIFALLLLLINNDLSVEILKKSILIGFVAGIFNGTCWGLIAFFQYHESLLQITTPYQRFIASAKALHFSILQHWLLRWQLKRAGVLPWDVIGFLNEMTARHLLETDGATWRFRHRILQEYFAGQWHAEGTAKQ